MLVKYPLFVHNHTSSDAFPLQLQTLLFCVLGVCQKMQRRIARAIKRSRKMGQSLPVSNSVDFVWPQLYYKCMLHVCACTADTGKGVFLHLLYILYCYLFLPVCSLLCRLTSKLHLASTTLANTFPLCSCFLQLCFYVH